MPPAGGGELGVRGDDARGHHRAYQIALAAPTRGDQRVELQSYHCGSHRLHVPVSGRGDDLEGLPHGRNGLSSKRATNQLDEIAGEVGEVAERFVLDRVAFTIAAAQQMGLVDLVLVGPPCGYYMDRTAPPSHDPLIADNAHTVKPIAHSLVTT